MYSNGHETGVYAVNLRRLMARDGMTLVQVVRATGICERTIKGVLSGRTKPHARTLKRLATGLGVSPDEFFEPAKDERRMAHERIHHQVDDLLANGQRELLAGLVELLQRHVRETSRPPSANGREPHLR